MSDKLESVAQNPEQLESIAQTLSGLQVGDMGVLVQMLEKKWGVSAAAALAPQGGADSAAGGASSVEAKTEFDVILSSFGSEKIGVIKEVRAITGLGLKEAKELVEGAPKTLKNAVSKEEAEKIKKQLESAGAKVEIK